MPMKTMLALDVYGTPIDPLGIAAAVFDPRGSEPTLTVASLAELAEALRAWQPEA
jgi:hypothetical protein